MALVRDRRNDDSVPTAYGHREVVVKGYVDTVVVVCGRTVIARHPRSSARDALIFEPRHDLALLERKTGALDQAAPLAGWELPEAFGRRRRLLPGRSVAGALRSPGTDGTTAASSALPRGLNAFGSITAILDHRRRPTQRPRERGRVLLIPGNSNGDGRPR